MAAEKGASNGFRKNSSAQFVGSGTRECVCNRHLRAAGLRCSSICRASRHTTRSTGHPAGFSHAQPDEPGYCSQPARIAALESRVRAQQPSFADASASPSPQSSPAPRHESRHSPGPSGCSARPLPRLKACILSGAHTRKAGSSWSRLFCSSHSAIFARFRCALRECALRIHLREGQASPSQRQLAHESRWAFPFRHLA